MKKVKRLHKGSKIAIISPSTGLPSVFSDIYELGLKNLSDFFGFEIVEMPSARMSIKELYLNPKLRAEDINNAFINEEIDGIICSIGGYESVRILEYLNEELIINNPKLLMGFSDATTFLSYINSLGLVTFYGPSIMAGFAQLQALGRDFIEHLDSFLFKNSFPYKYNPYNSYTEGYKDWANLDTLGECLDFYNNETGFEFIQGRNEVEGFLWGGCIEVLEFLKGTKYWPNSDFWNDKILFLETSEDKPSPDNVGYMLRNYGTQGILNKINGIIIARPKDYTLEEKDELKKIIKDILQIEFNCQDIPVVMNVDFGHTDPKLILPLGCKVKLIPRSEEIILIECPFM